MMKPRDRHRVIEEYLNQHERVDILHAPFVEHYAKATGVKIKEQMWGAPKCPTLSRDLAFLYNCNILQRSKIGINDSVNFGFPKWVYVYSLRRSLKKV